MSITPASCFGPITAMRWLGQREHEAGVVGPAGHAVVAGAVAGPDHQREVRDLEFDTALMSLAPLLDDAALLGLASPTMKPVMFCRNSSGVSVWLHSWMNCAPFCDSSENRMPLLAEDADREAADRRPAAHELVAVERLELLEPAAVDDAGDDLADVERDADVGRGAAEQLVGVVQRRRRRARWGRARACASRGARRCRGRCGWRRARRRPGSRTGRWCASASRRRRASPRRRSSSMAIFTSGGPPRYAVPGPSRRPCSRSCPACRRRRRCAGPKTDGDGRDAQLRQLREVLEARAARHEDVGLAGQVGAGGLVER